MKTFRRHAFRRFLEDESFYKSLLSFVLRICVLPGGTCITQTVAHSSPDLAPVSSSSLQC